MIILFKEKEKKRKREKLFNQIDGEKKCLENFIFEK